MTDYSENDYLFREGDEAKEIHILMSGKVECILKDTEGNQYRLFEIEEKNALIGVLENLIGTKRVSEVKVISETADIKKIDLTKKNLKSTILANPALGLTVSINLSKRIKEANSQVTNVSKLLNKVKEYSDKYCHEYYKVVEQISDLNKKTRFPWLENIYKAGKQSIIYSYGQSVHNGQDFLDEMIEKKEIKAKVEREQIGTANAISFKPGEVLCVEGDIGSEMYILAEGSLNVFVGDTKVAEIDEKGSIIGEIAVLIGYSTKEYEKRTATVKAKTDAKVLVLPGDKLNAIITRDPNLIMHIAGTLAERIPTSYTSFLEVSEKISKAIGLLNPISATSGTCPKAYKTLLDTTHSNTKNPDLVQDIIEKIEKLNSESKKAYNELEEIQKSLA